MMDKEVKRYEATDYNEVVEFIKRVTAVETVDEHIIEQSILIKQNQQMVGMVAFEPHNQVGVIRYFIYDQQVMPDLLVNMFFELYRCAKEKEVNQLVAMTSNDYSRQLFSLLGFVTMPKKSTLDIPEMLKSDDVQLMGIKF